MGCKSHFPEKELINLGLAEVLGGKHSGDIIPGKIDPHEQRKQEEAYWEQRKKEESGECITRKPTPVECLQLGIPLEKAQQMTPADLTKEDAEILLQAGVLKKQIKKVYGFKNYPALYALLTQWGLHRPSPRKKKQDIEIKMNPTIQEKEKFFEEQQPTTVEKPAGCETYYDLSKFERIGGDTLPPIGNYLHVSSRGDIRISGTSFVPGDKVDFFVNKLDLQLDKIPAGHLIIIKKSENGRTLHREKKTKRSFRISCRLLVGSLKQKGVPLPARYRLEWSEKMQAWVGRIV